VDDNRHPGNHPGEEQYLAETVEFIDSEIQRLKGPPPWAAHNETAKRLKEMNDEKLERYQTVRPRPYFGRVDFMQEEGGDPTKGYVGTVYIPEHVFSWTSPYARQLFYADPQRVSSYKAPKGQIRGRITLKRQYAIQNSRLLDATEVYRSLPSPDGRTVAEDSSESFMTKQLSQGRGGELREVVATIQPDQYQQIAAAPGQVMVVQGVAGSGKSIVGLHRIAYLLSPFNERTERITASKVVFFGPTRTFLKYVANLLPSLDVRQVTQTTVRDWLQSTLSDRVYLDRGEPLIEKLLRHKGKNWQLAHQAARLKGSLQMARTLARHVEALRKRFVQSAAAMAVRLESATPIILHAVRVRQVVRQVPAGSLNAQRQRVIDRLVDALWDEYTRQRSKTGSGIPRTTRSEFTERVSPQVEQQVATFWPRVDFRQEYRRLLSDAGVLAVASRGRMIEQESVMLTSSLPKHPNVFQVEDLGALSYLDHLLNDHPRAGFEHVVLDEAQEVSVLDLSVIRLHSQGNGFTILGDLTQSLSPHGIEHWQEVLRLFGGATVSWYVARTSYRATYEITRYANRLLKQAGPRAVTAVPFRRHGPPPSFSPARTYNEMVTAITGDIKELERHGAKTIGVLCKSAVDAKKLHRALHDQGLEIGLLNRNEVPTESIVVAPTYLTRGLEYDGVILAGASKEHYPTSPLHTKLLYLAVSRAAHYLHIHWIGQPAPQLGVGRRTSRGRKPGGRRNNQRSRK
jgi:DNA helicase-2/ATP-dependent DNA helicase PcrA